ncbi:MAG TPA: methyltransferase domain-containing protein [Verrucomicrobiae bacterium]|nr:methyltransferase domain-containing protein [Verrucomicrobiae bacterium]
MNAWEERYQSGDRHWDKGEPAPGLVDFLRDHPELPRGAVAVPGCGLGHDVRAWTAGGFAAHGFDIAPTAIQLAREAQPQAGDPGSDIAPTFTLANFLHDPPPMPFDYLFEHTLFCAIEPAERDNYVTAALRWLKPGGTYIAINYILCDGEPPFPVDREELWRRFQPHFHLIDQWIPRSYPNRTGRELMSWWRRK